MAAAIDKLIICSPYKEPGAHWEYFDEKDMFVETPGRRPAGYFVASQESNRYNDLGRFEELPLVNAIRPRVRAWREAGFPGVTGVTRELLSWWDDSDARSLRFFWCQLDAIETLIWLEEAPDADKVGVDVPGDGGAFGRLCTKLCTGGGKTTIMAMLIAWQVCNKVTYPQDARFSKNVLVVAPGLTVRNRLQVLKPGGEDNYFDHFGVVPRGLADKLNQAKVIVTNWQALSWETEEQIAKKKTVDKRGPLSDAAYARGVLGDMASTRNLIVINDEAHHAWRTNPVGTKGYVRARDALKGDDKQEYKDSEAEATVWVGGLDRIARTCGIRRCYDFSATPFAPSGKRNSDEALFGWIVSDFGLNDGIESGLVKTPRVVYSDDGIPDAKTMRSRLYHIYADPEVKDDINRKAEPQEPLPSILMTAYHLLGRDWERTSEEWGEAGLDMPPVMLTVANRTETAARIEYSFLHNHIDIPGLCDKDAVLRIDSKVVKDADEARSDAYQYGADVDSMGSKDRESYLRAMSDTVGQRGEPGQDVRNVISVGMLSEGWDARTVTHIMGLRAFSSQLLCEQVIGRGLRRTSYDVGVDGLLSPEYVDIFGIPFTFLPHEGNDGPVKPPKPRTQVGSLPERSEYEIGWPNVIRINRQLKYHLSLDYEKMEPLALDANDIIMRADLGPTMNGQIDLTKLTDIDLRDLDKKVRLHHEVFNAATQVYENLDAGWKGRTTAAGVFGQLVDLTDHFLRSDKLRIEPAEFAHDELRRRILITLSTTKIVQHIWDYIRYSQTDGVVPVFGQGRRIWSTADMPTWFTTKPTFHTEHSQVNRCVVDSSWEMTEGYILDHMPDKVLAWAKNDHLGFRIQYVFGGVVRSYIPDYLAKLKGGSMLVIETKGQETERDKTKRRALTEWVDAVNASGDFGHWENIVSYSVMDLEGKVEEVLLGNGGE